MTLSDMERAVDEANATLSRADMLADKLARLLIGRLKRVSSGYVLRALKKELANYNMHTGDWK